MVTAEKSDVSIWKEFEEKRDINTRNKIILQYEYLVRLVVSKLITKYKSCNEYDDFISYGMFGLIDAVEKYNYRKGVKFETYASIRIRGSIIDNIRKQDWISTTLRHKIRKAEEAFDKLEYELGRPATEEEVANHLNIKTEELHKLMIDSYTANIVYFDELVSSAVYSSINLQQSKKDMPDEKYEKKELIDLLAKGISKLSKREKMFIALYYFEELNQKEIGLVLGVTESRISQIHSEALIKLRTYIKNAM